MKHSLLKTLSPTGFNLPQSLQALPISLRPSTRRKTLAISLYPGEVRVAYPKAIPQRELVAWLAQKQAWILKHYRPAESSAQDPLSHGCKIWWCGEQLALDHDALETLKLPENFFSLPFAEKKRRWLSLCLRHSQEQIPERLSTIQQRMTLFCGSLKLRPYKSCWGSCNHRGVVAINSLLIMAPGWVVDYVITHELAHLPHPNHSRKFWQLVAKHLPAGSSHNARQWLRQHGSEILKIYR